MANQNPANQLQIADNIAGAEYSNFANIRYNQEEFQMAFANVFPPSGRVVAKLITTPAHFKRMIMAMSENLKKYEEQFGLVKEVEMADAKEIGF
jgi:hypothetical protein